MSFSPAFSSFQANTGCYYVGSRFTN